MLKALLLPLLFVAGVASGQDAPAVVTTAQLDAAVAGVTAQLSPDDPSRETLLELYRDTRAALADAERFRKNRESFAQARASAAKRAEDIQAGLAERDVAPAPEPGKTESASLADLEQRLQIARAELDARKSVLADIRAAINAMPDRATEIRARLTGMLDRFSPD